MSFPRYPAYKDSGIEWLGEVPAEWTIKRLMHVCDFESGKAHEPFIDDDGEFVCVTSRFVSTAGEARKYCTTNLSPARKDDILMVMSDLPNGRALGRAYFVNDDSPYAVNQRVCIISAREVNPRFAFFLLDRSLGFLQHDDGMNQTHLSTATFRQFPMLIPSTSEQEQITAFLDRETAKIDSLVAEQEQLITLLKEKRQAVISHAVTKGLDPSVPMKDSGVEWLGEVPAHWGIAQFRRHVAIAEGQVDPEDSPYADMVLIAPNHVESATGRLIAQETASEQGAESGKYLCAKGDVIYSKIRPALRKVCLAPIDCLCSADMYPLKPHSGLKSDFLVWYMLSEGFSALAVLESERVAMPKINRETLNPVPLVIPPEVEQESISVYLSTKTAEFDRLTAKASDAVTLLQERRSALISAAVTGQIDVRGLAPAQEQAA